MPFVASILRIMHPSYLFRMMTCTAALGFVSISQGNVYLGLESGVAQSSGIDGWVGEYLDRRI